MSDVAMTWAVFAVAILVGNEVQATAERDRNPLQPAGRSTISSERTAGARLSEKQLPIIPAVGFAYEF